MRVSLYISDAKLRARNDPAFFGRWQPGPPRPLAKTYLARAALTRQIGEHPIPSVRGVKLVGERWVDGTRSPGFGQAVLSDGRTVSIPEAGARGFRGVLDFCDDTRDERARVSEWVRAGA